jgi:ABC-type polysaccharide/polyol phosphate export permease
MLNTAIKDARESIARLPVAFFFAWSDVKARYRRSVLGPLWMVITTAVGVVGLGFLWSVLFNVDKDVFIPSLTIGLVVWQFISGCIIEAPTTFVRQGNLIRNIKTPYLIFPVQLLLRQIINFAHNIIIVILVLIVFPPKIVDWTQLLVIPGLILLIGNLFWMVTIAGILGARYRDLEQLIGAVMPMLFFLSPVIYRPAQLGVSQYIAWLNPLAYLISLVRDPMQGTVPAQFIYVVSALMMVIGIIMTMILLNKKQGRIAFWV